MPSNQVSITAQGNKYEYFSHPIGTSFKSVGGNYAFAYLTQTGWYILYIGQTNDLSARLSNHEKLTLAQKKGATHILAHVNTSEQGRKSEESILISAFKPVLNELLK